MITARCAMLVSLSDTDSGYPIPTCSVQLARIALASRKNERLSISHLRTVLKADEAFNRDFHRTDRSETLYT